MVWEWSTAVLQQMRASQLFIPEEVRLHPSEAGPQHRGDDQKSSACSREEEYGYVCLMCGVGWKAHRIGVTTHSNHTQRFAQTHNPINVLTRQFFLPRKADIIWTIPKFKGLLRLWYKHFGLVALCSNDGRFKKVSATSFVCSEPLHDCTDAWVTVSPQWLHNSYPLQNMEGTTKPQLMYVFIHIYSAKNRHSEAASILSNVKWVKTRQQFVWNVDTVWCSAKR